MKPKQTAAHAALIGALAAPLHAVDPANDPLVVRCYEDGAGIHETNDGAVRLLITMSATDNNAVPVETGWVGQSGAVVTIYLTSYAASDSSPYPQLEGVLPDQPAPAEMTMVFSVLDQATQDTSDDVGVISWIGHSQWWNVSYQSYSEFPGWGTHDLFFDYGHATAYFYGMTDGGFPFHCYSSEGYSFEVVRESQTIVEE